MFKIWLEVKENCSLFAEDPQKNNIKLHIEKEFSNTTLKVQAV